ncbi:hypothetical protein A3712_00300 [Vibrio sp. HI00D65]|uniref:SDR family NAD(P)-dependent oxidoreductase n=1 Tax=Vibrio sp. HI00D65 TaxID=1822216 RepID=UPI0007C31DB6|nr:SDR family oxidoreductase [Vibrio sp. HI00D65]KZX70650.1 hypothetical protein A3712_00300 [Vibrio sp. HI00D65]
MKNKVVIITGGSKGLGYELVKQFLDSGYKVATFSRKLNRSIETLQKNESFFWMPVDAEKFENLKEFHNQVKGKFGQVDILINNSAYLFEGLLSFTPMIDIDKTINLNLTNPIKFTKLCISSMIKNKSGVIINISSINSVRGHKGVSVYTASKAGLDGITRSLAKELAPSNIRVNTISPGFFETELVSYLNEERRNQILKRTPLGRIAKIQDISNAVLFIASDKASFITGQNIIVDGGMTC